MSCTSQQKVLCVLSSPALASAVSQGDAAPSLWIPEERGHGAAPWLTWMTPKEEVDLSLSKLLRFGGGGGIRHRSITSLSWPTQIQSTTPCPASIWDLDRNHSYTRAPCHCERGTAILEWWHGIAKHGRNWIHSLWVFRGPQFDADQHWSQFLAEKYLKGNTGSGCSRDRRQYDQEGGSLLKRCSEAGSHYPPAPSQHLNTAKSIRNLDPTTGKEMRGTEAYVQISNDQSHWIGLSLPGK